MGNLENLFADNPNVGIVGYIYETDDYSMFKKLEGNRDVEKTGKLKKSMKKNGFLNCPAVVNEELEVIDGQNRIFVAEELKIPVKFCIQPMVGIEETKELNSGQKNWSTLNYLHSNAIGNNNYARFEQLHNMFGYSPDIIYASMGANITGGGVTGIIRSGGLKCTEEQYEEATKTLKYLTMFNELVKNSKIKGSKSNFYIAVMFARRSEGINSHVLAQRIKDNFHVFGTYLGSTEECVRKVESAYNYKVPADNRIYLVDKYRKLADESLARYKKRG